MPPAGTPGPPPPGEQELTVSSPSPLEEAGSRGAEGDGPSGGMSGGEEGSSRSASSTTGETGEGLRGWPAPSTEASATGAGAGARAKASMEIGWRCLLFLMVNKTQGATF